MSKNAQRLQKIENDVKAVISIYDVATKTPNENKKVEKQRIPRPISKVLQSKLSDNSKSLEKSRKENPNGRAISKSEAKSSISRRNGNSAMSLPKIEFSKKPGSAPTSSKSSSTNGEVGLMWHPKSDTKQDIELTPDSKLKGNDELNSSDWLNYSNLESEIFMTPSKTLETAKEILAKNYFLSEEGIKSEVPHKTATRGKEPKSPSPTRKKDEEHKKPTGKSISTLKKGETETTLSAITKKKNLSEKDLPTGNKHSATKPVAYADTHNEIKKEKSFTEVTSSRQGTCKKIQRVEKPKDDRDKSTTKRKTSESKESKERKKNWDTIYKTEGESWVASEEEVPGRKSEAEKTKTEGSTKGIRDGKNTADSNSVKEKKVKKPLGTANASQKSLKSCVSEKGEKTEKVEKMEKMEKTEKMEKEELGAEEITKIIEKSNEKLEKMKASKELALDIAKHLKHQYEEIKTSKEELMAKLHMVEKENERLCGEIRSAQESNENLHLKMKNLCVDSKTKIKEQEFRTDEIISENSWLKGKLGEMEKELTEVLEKQKQIDKVQRNRFMDSKNEFKKLENKTQDDIKKLKSEKVQLLSKVEELQKLLNDRSSKMEVLEEKKTQLQEEVRKQKQSLKQKTDRLEDTNRELESIRQNSKDLEDQVKMLRQNIENFDRMHQNLINKTNIYEQQLKKYEEDLKKLQEENAQLKKELEDGKDSLLIKNKIIEDQQETIKQLRDKSDEVKNLMKRNQSLERILNIEREEKLELEEALERLKWRKEELKKKIKDLEGDLLLAPQEVVRDLQKTQKVLHELENQVQVKQKEWETHLQTLIKEKEQACSVAEFATKKLMQTTNEFQRQSETQKRLHRVLAENLAEKERHIREVNEKTSVTRLKELLAELHQEDNKKVRFNEKPALTRTAVEDWAQKKSPFSAHGVYQTGHIP